MGLISAAYAASQYCPPNSPPTSGFGKNIPGGFDDPGCGHPDINVALLFVINIINFALQFAAAIAVIMLIVGGITYIVSRSRPDLIDKAYQTIKYSIVGIVVIVLSYVIIYGINQFVQTGGRSG